MSFNSDPPKLSKNYKSLSIYAILFPFWIVTVYIFHPSLYQKKDFVIIAALCMCLTFCTALIMTLIMIKKKGLKGENAINHHTTYTGVVFQIIQLSLLIFIFYILKIIFNWVIPFYGFISIHFGIQLFFLMSSFFLKRPPSDNE